MVNSLQTVDSCFLKNFSISQNSCIIEKKHHCDKMAEPQTQAPENNVRKKFESWLDVLITTIIHLIPLGFIAALICAGVIFSIDAENGTTTESFRIIDAYCPIQIVENQAIPNNYCNRSLDAIKLSLILAIFFQGYSLICRILHILKDMYAPEQKDGFYKSEPLHFAIPALGFTITSFSLFIISYKEFKYQNGNLAYEQKSLMDAQKFYILLIAVAAGQVIEMIVFYKKTKDMTFLQLMKHAAKNVVNGLVGKGGGRKAKSRNTDF